MNSEAKKTPLYQCHKSHNAKMVDFAGWLMPVQYQGIQKEHQCVRQQVGLFDVSHMGQLRFRGKNACSALDFLTTNYVESLRQGRAQYTLLCNEQGGVVDDLIIYCVEEQNDYLLCVNAANTKKDFDWIEKKLQENGKDQDEDLQVINESDQWALIALQGPQAAALLDRLWPLDQQSIDPGRVGEASSLLVQWPTTASWSDTKPFDVFCLSPSLMVARTGYTGEWGVEIFVTSGEAPALWEQLMKQGDSWGIQPVGLGARDTLRLEMKYSLYGQELDDTTTPWEADLGWVVKAEKKDFVGKEALVQQKEKGVQRALVGFFMKERGIPRHGYSLVDEQGQSVGVVTSGTMMLGEALGIGYVDSAYKEIGSRFFVEMRGRKVEAEVVPTPFQLRGGTSEKGV